ncbi:helix-turn-helix domain-containing protein [Bdellovibrionota bacterium FG-1]
MTLGEQLKHIRKTYGLTQKKLADQSGVSFSFINSVETGSSSMRLETLNKVLALVGCEIAIVDKKTKKVIGA